MNKIHPLSGSGRRFRSARECDQFVNPLIALPEFDTCIKFKTINPFTERSRPDEWTKTDGANRVVSDVDKTKIESLKYHNY
jgi:hypothetical protein